MGQGKIPREQVVLQRKRMKQQKIKELKENKLNQPKQLPRTLESVSLTESDPTMTTIQAMDENILGLEFNQDEFSASFDGTRIPKIIITTQRRASKASHLFANELAGVFFNAKAVNRRSHHEVRQIIREAIQEDVTDILIIGERLKEPCSLTMIHLPNGPTAYFKLSSIRSAKSIRNHGNPTDHPPELIMNHFNKMLGATIGRFFLSLFPQVPQFSGRQVVTFHNQRDFLFFRRHRYMFEEEDTDSIGEDSNVDSIHSISPSSSFSSLEGGNPTQKAKKVNVIEKVRLQELGPRFTLKLYALQKGTHDKQGGEYIWLRKKHMNTRKSFHI